MRLSSLSPLSDEMRERLRASVERLFGEGRETIDLDTPLGDPGLFGPQSMTWKVHADLTTMMAGGIAALLLQMLHPAALAGIWDHSHWREDRTGRLRRTAQFIAATSYGSVVEAERLIARVNRVHDAIAGVLPDGTAYRANDPDLLRWVHVAETYSFLAAYRRYLAPSLREREARRYYGEMALLARKLGAADVPVTSLGVQDYLEAMRPQMHADARMREVAATLLTPARGDRSAMAARLVMEAAIDLLPPWAARMHGFKSGPRRHLARAGVAGLGMVMRWAVQDGAARRAKRRMAGGAL